MIGSNKSDEQNLTRLCVSWRSLTAMIYQVPGLLNKRLVTRLVPGVEFVAVVPAVVLAGGNEDDDSSQWKVHGKPRMRYENSAIPVKCAALILLHLVGVLDKLFPLVQLVCAGC